MLPLIDDSEPFDQNMLAAKEQLYHALRRIGLFREDPRISFSTTSFKEHTVLEGSFTGLRLEFLLIRKTGQTLTGFRVTINKHNLPLPAQFVYAVEPLTETQELSFFEQAISSQERKLSAATASG